MSFPFVFCLSNLLWLSLSPIVPIDLSHIVNFLNIVPKRYFRHLLRSSGDRSTASPMCDIPAIDVLLEFLSHQMDLVSNSWL